MEDRDIIAMAKDETDAVVQVFFVREGKLIGRDHFHVTVGADEGQKEILTSFVKQFYSGTPFVPRELWVQTELDDAETIASWLELKRGQKVKLVVPQKGEKERLRVRPLQGRHILRQQVAALQDDVLPVFQAGLRHTLYDAPHFPGNLLVWRKRRKAGLSRPNQAHFEMVKAGVGNAGAQHEPVGKQRFADVAFSPNQDNHFATPFRQILFGRVRGAKKPSRGPFSGKGSFPAQGKNRLEEDFCPAQTPFQGLFYLRSSPKSQVYRKATSSPACTVCCDALWEKLSPLTK